MLNQNNYAILHKIAPAKINLYLHVTGKRPDGYHLLDSLVVFASVGDQITAARGKTVQLAVSGPYAGTLVNHEDNIVLKAVKLFQKSASITKGIHIQLYKNLPVSAGIGGGSADAAAMLSLFPQLWDVPTAKEELYALAQQLGADVSVCLAGKASYMSGIGEILEEGPVFPPLPALLVNPNIPLSTPEVFSARQGEFTAQAPRISSPVSQIEIVNWLHTTQNDLQEAACHCVPAIKRVLSELASLQGCEISRMSGSGATCFGIFPTEDAARDAAHQLRRIYPDWWIQPCVLNADNA